MTTEPLSEAQLAEWERIAALDYCPVREEEIASAVPALIALITLPLITIAALLWRDRNKPWRRLDE